MVPAAEKRIVGRRNAIFTGCGPPLGAAAHPRGAVHSRTKKRAQELRPTRFFGMAMYPTPGVGRSSCARFLVRLCTAPLGWAAAPKGGPQPVKMAFLRPTILFSAAGTTDYA